MALSQETNLNKCLQEDLHNSSLNNSQKEKILLVDDTVANLNLASDFLTEAGFEVLSVKSGFQALKILEKVSPDLILLDVVMPEMDGFETCHHLKAWEKTKDIPVIFMTAVADFANPANKVKGLTLGAVDYISKPIQLDEVLARVKTHLQLRSLTKQLTEQNALLQREIRDRICAEQALQESAITLRNHNRVLTDLAKNRAIHQGDWQVALKEIAEAIANNIAVERASVWLFDETGTLLQCLNLFERSLNRHSTGGELAVANYPAYFQALSQEQLIVAGDAHTAPQTRELSEFYLTPLGITSMLDAPIRLRGQTVGVLCSEHIGAARHWTLEDQNFVRSVTDLVSLALEARERQRAETALQQSEERLHLAMEGGALGLWDWHIATGQTYLAPQWKTMLGYEGDEIGDDYQSWAQLIHPEDVPRRIEALNAYWDGCIPAYEVEFRMQAHSGEWQWILTRGKVFERDEFGAPLRMLGVHKDISDRKLAEESVRQSEAREHEKATRLELALDELKRTQTKLVQAEKMSSLGQMVAGVAHEINNPIGFIYGNLAHTRHYFQDLLKLVETYQMAYPNSTAEIQEITSEIDLEFLVEDLPKVIDSMQGGAERIYDIVRSLRNFSRLDESELKVVNIHEGIDNTLLFLQHRLKPEGDSKLGNGSIVCPEIEVIKDYSQLPLVTCYASQLNQVFMNLIENAIDALETRPAPRIITIRTEVSSIQPSVASDKEQQPTDSIVIRITDNGFGMIEDIQKKIFDPFFTTKPVGSGTGLGLFVSYKIVVEKHGGQLNCISSPGQGAEFILEIPVRPKLPKVAVLDVSSSEEESI